jgi:hypothetical protein
MLVAEFLARSGDSANLAASVLLLFGFVVALVSWIGTETSGDFMRSVNDTISDWWGTFARHVDVA